MGPLPEKILAKKLKKREKKKTEMLKKKKDAEIEAKVREETKVEEIEEEAQVEDGVMAESHVDTTDDVVETAAEQAVEKSKKKHKIDNGEGPPKKKKKKIAVKEAKKAEDEETKGESDSEMNPLAAENKDNVPLPGSSLGLGILSDKSFAGLAPLVSAVTLQGVADMGFTSMTEIQAQTVPHLLEGRDLVGAAKTGSGKTLAFLVPAVELVYKLKFMPR
jgi:ATP-dependent RNA helicase DDX18/HAS1